MSAQRRNTAKVLSLLTEAGWVESSFVSDMDIKVKWTPLGEKRMRELLHLGELPRAINGTELAFMVSLAHHFFDNPWHTSGPESPET